MSARVRWMLVALVSVLALGATASVGAVAWAEYQQRASAPSAVDVVVDRSWAGGDRVVFRNTASGEGYGHVASVPLDDPGATRQLSGLVCDRVDATVDALTCLHTERGLAPTFTAAVHTAGGEAVAAWPLPGIPSRTRISDDGALIASTAFVTGHSYATIGFSTETVIHRADGTDLGNLEEWELIVDGATSAPVDRNFWGVTFADETTFYATVGLTLAGTTHLVVGDIEARTLQTLAENVECPSLSPDGTRIAFKRVTAGAGPTVHWTPAVYDLTTGEVTVLPESRSIDDQIEWLDDATILYGMPRADAAGDYDVWSLPADGSGEAEVLIEHAWSPAVVRGTATTPDRDGEIGTRDG